MGEDETDVDCGGSCAACSEGQRCQVANDCMTRFCDNSGETPLCRDCLEPDDCSSAPATFCESGTCVDTRVDSTACTESFECASGFCVDGFCCDSACDSECKSCAAADTGGSNGQCLDVLASLGPMAECPVAAPETCGNTGVCEAGACQKHGTEVACAVVACEDPGILFPARNCSGAGVCAGQSSLLCPNGYACLNATACRTDCSVTEHCFPGYTCNGSACVP